MASQDSWSGWIVFAGFLIVIVGAMDVLQGFVGILEDEYVVATPKGLAIVDVTAWGWITLLWGGLLILAGLALLGGAGWARWLAIIARGGQRDRADRVSGELPPGVSPLEHPDRHTQHPRALRADGALAGLQAVHGLIEDLGSDRGGCCPAPSIRRPQRSVTASRSGRDETGAAHRGGDVAAERYERPLWRVSIRSSRALI